MNKNGKRVHIRRAFVSVSDKTDLVAFVQSLSACGIEIISTGGTAGVLRSARIPVRDVTEITGFPEILDGRVKSLHPKVHGAVLGGRDNPDHVNQMLALGIEPVDLVVCNLYPFEKAVSSRSSQSICLEHIDIGGWLSFGLPPRIIRASLLSSIRPITLLSKSL